MCFGATCPACSKRSWRGCGSHISQALKGVPEEQWCTCQPRVSVNGKNYPPAAQLQIPDVSWITGMFRGKADAKSGSEAGGKGEL